jgi:5-methylthioadenosine/S-adenosylhomocysteine deaminase
MDSVVGSVESGKQADLAIVRVDREHVEPGGNIFSKLVYACQARDVLHVMVRGELVVTFGEHLFLDAEKIAANARAQAKLLTKRAGLA